MNKLIFMVLLIPFVMGQTEEISNSITKDIWIVPVCYDASLVLVSAEKQITEGDYRLPGCTLYEENKWRCPCRPESINQTITIIANKSNVFDFRIQYYVEPLLPDDNNTLIDENDNSKRIENINNVIISIPKKPFNLDTFVTNNKWPIIVFFGIIVFIFIDVVIVIRWLFRDNTPKRPNFIKTDKKQTKNDNLTDEEVLELVKKL